MTARDVLHAIADTLDIAWSARPNHDGLFLDLVLDELHRIVNDPYDRLFTDLDDDEPVEPIRRPVETVAIAGDRL
jgi:hypothetical protein